jgi:hypothetical protein
VTIDVTEIYRHPIVTGIVTTLNPMVATGYK